MALVDQTAAELLAELQGGRVTSVEVTEAYLRQIERFETAPFGHSEQLNGYIVIGKKQVQIAKSIGYKSFVLGSDYDLILSVGSQQAPQFPGHFPSTEDIVNKTPVRDMMFIQEGPHFRCHFLVSLFRYEPD